MHSVPIVTHWPYQRYWFKPQLLPWLWLDEGGGVELAVDVGAEAEADVDVEVIVVVVD